MKILFISDIFGKYASANGACSKEIVDVLIERGHEVHVLQERFKNYEPNEEVIEKVHVHRIATTLHKKMVVLSSDYVNTVKGKLFHYLSRFLGIRTLFLLPWYPMRSPILCLRYANAAEKLHKKINFDMIISCFSPLGSLYAGERLKKKYSVPFVSYYLDTLTDNVEKKYFLTKKFMDNKGYNYEKRFFSSSDLILNMKCHEINFKQKKYDLFQRKLKITDIPHLKNRITIQKGFNKSEKLKLVYTGSIRKASLPGMITILSKTDNIKLHFYSPNCVEVGDYSFVKKHGQVTRLQALEVQESSDCLISMGNLGSPFIPSKIFEYMSTGKPIIHFYHDNSDSCLYYYKKYRNCCLINLNNKDDDNARQIMDFLNNHLIHINWNELENLFSMNKSEYTVDLIERSI